MKVFPSILTPIATASSYNTDWFAVGVEEYRFSARGAQVLPIDSFLIPINVGSSFQCEFKVNNKTYKKECFPGSVVILLADITFYRVCWDSPLHMILLNLPPELLANKASQFFGCEEFEMPYQLAINDSLVYDLGLKLRREMLAQNPHGAMYTESIAECLAAHLLHDYSNKEYRKGAVTGPFYPKELKRAIEYIHDCLADNITLNKLSNFAQTSTSHLRRLFKELTGQNPCEYWIWHRIKRSKRLISEGRKLADIAYACGFCSQSHFNRIFKEKTGVTPGEYKSSL